MSLSSLVSVLDAEYVLSPGLYVVSTPLGNPYDISLRAIQVLKNVDVVACEDTRVTRKLLAFYGIDRPLLSYRDHNEQSMTPGLLQRLQKGARIALVSDAGTPLLSDPGYRLVTACREHVLPVMPVPGPSAVVCALSIAGLPVHRFLFAGFPKPRRVARLKELETFKNLEATLVFYEAPHRLLETLQDMATVFGPRLAVVARELTKTYEEVIRMPLPSLRAHYEKVGAPRGEIVVLVAPPQVKASYEDQELSALLQQMFVTQSFKEAVAEVTRITGRPKREIYRHALALKEGSRHDDDNL